MEMEQSRREGKLTMQDRNKVLEGGRKIRIWGTRENVSLRSRAQTAPSWQEGYTVYAYTAARTGRFAGGRMRKIFSVHFSFLSKIRSLADIKKWAMESERFNEKEVMCAFHCKAVIHLRFMVINLTW